MILKLKSKVVENIENVTTKGTVKIRCSYNDLEFDLNIMFCYSRDSNYNFQNKGRRPYSQLPYLSIQVRYVAWLSTYHYYWPNFSFVIYGRIRLKNKFLTLTLKCQPHKMVKHTQTIVRRQQPTELFECILPFCVAGGWSLKG